MWGICRQQKILGEGRVPGTENTLTEYDKSRKLSNSNSMIKSEMSRYLREIDTRIEIVNNHGNLWSRRRTLWFQCKQWLRLWFHAISIDRNQVIVLSHVELVFAVTSHVIWQFRILEKLPNVNALSIIWGS